MKNNVIEAKDVKLTGSFKNYEVLSREDWWNLRCDNDESVNYTNLKYKCMLDYWYDSTDNINYELMILDKNIYSENDWDEYIEIHGDGLTLEEVEKSLEQQYEDYLNGVGEFASQEPEITIPELAFLKFQKGVENNMFKISRSFYEKALENLQNLILKDEYTIFIYKNFNCEYYKVTGFEYNSLDKDNIKHNYFPDMDSDGDYLKQVMIRDNIVYFNRRGCIYEMTLERDGKLRIQPLKLDIEYILRFSQLEKSSKDEVCDLWLSQSMDLNIKNPLKKHQYLEALSFLKE